MPIRSAGILPYRFRGGRLQVLLAHPGGPFWSHKDAGSWSIFKGLLRENESPLAAARREFQEETGSPVEGDLVDLGELKQPSGKLIRAFAVEGDLDVEQLKSNSFSLEWPPRSGELREYPEIDRGQWFPLAAAGIKIIQGQRDFLTRLAQAVGSERQKETR